ncbi:DUF3313 domain-containing protein [Corallincola luteus]|uniref:DUF3313 domain-containing protein n=1 Tax=Corallincola luteus TaxID=1775177 RepID=A0ABY2AI55_9GAMM|nr:DUF3313 family protein [Corallincola luteus]TCI02362.1 DUF3313 domain-containing protein [Corallincola luteus]
MKLKFITSSIIATALFSMMGCSSAPDVEDSHSGFLSSYDQLKPVKDDENFLRWRADGFNPNEYGTVEFEPTQVILSDELKKESSLNIETQKELAEYFSQKMVSEFGTEQKVGESTKVLQLKTAFTGITNSKEDLAAWQYLPITFITTAGFRDDMPMLFVEFEAIDTETNVIVSQAMQRIVMETVDPDKLNEMGVDAIKPEIDKAVAKLRKQFEKSFEEE